MWWQLIPHVRLSFNNKKVVHRCKQKWVSRSYRSIHQCASAVVNIQDIKPVLAAWNRQVASATLTSMLVSS